MNWKEFFKLDWKKILFIIVLSGLTYGYLLFPVPQTAFYEPSLLTKILIVILGCPFRICSPLLFKEVPEIRPEGILCLLISSLITWYLISCIIVFISENLKKILGRKKKI